jgi:hypothetical protein
VLEKASVKKSDGFYSLFFTVFLVLGIALYPILESIPGQNH